jgi:thiosulfate/3-mercaptopyruvate sulfurtransferase
MLNQATKPGKEAIDLNMQSDIGDAAERIPAKTRRSRFRGTYGLAVSSLALLALSSSLRTGYGGNLVTLDSEHLGGGIFEYRLTCNPQPYLERSGLSNFSLPFPGFDGVVQEPMNWQRAPGFPTPPQAEASLEWLHNQTNQESLPYQCAFRVRTQKPAFRLGTSQLTNVLHWNDWAQPPGYRTNVQERLTLRCLVPCDLEQSDGSPPLYHDGASDFPEINISQCYLAASPALRLGIAARPGLPLCLEATEDLNSWHRVNFLAASGSLTPWTVNTAQAGPHQFYRAVARKPEFAHPEALASTQWLEQHLGDASVRIVDSRYPQSDAGFKSGHIPGAVKVDPATDLKDPTVAGLYLVPTAAQFETLMNRLGVSNTTTVVVYDTDGGLWSGRCWWVLRYYGHENVRLLHGGLEKWRRELRPLETAVVLPAPATFTAQAHPELRATFTEVQAAIGNTNIIILNALPADQYTAGHIPTSKNVPAPSNLANYVLRLPPEQLAATYVQAGVTPDKEVITYCGGGYYGAFSLFVLYELGYENIRLYDGSWLEWVSKGGAIETGP